MEYKYVSFDSADQSFKFYTSLEWHNLIANAKEELRRVRYWQQCSVEEALEATFGNEFFWEEIV